MNVINRGVSTLLVTDFGWNLDDGKYKIKWCEGDVSPRCLDIVCTDEDMEIEEGV